jgi:Secretion system C-terminal sorting domain
MTASKNGQNGSVKVERNNIVAAGGDLTIETGASGSTEVKDSRLVSSTRIRIATGPGGNCVSEPNGLFAPVKELCGVITTTLVQKGAAIAMAEQQQMTGVKIYPNPGSNGMVNVSLGNSSDAVDILVADINGRVIRQWRNFKNNTLLISELTTGVYSLQIINHKSGKRTAERFVIIGQ